MMPPAGWLRRGKRKFIAAGAAVAVVTSVLFSVIGSKINTVPVGDPATITLSLLASRDIGRLPARGTSAGQFCGSVGTLGAPEHCYQLQEASGNLADEVGGLTLTAAGTPRYAVVPGVPIESSGVADFTSEKQVQMDASGSFTAVDTPAAVATITAVWVANRNASGSFIADWGYYTTAGYSLWITSAGVLTAGGRFGAAISRTVNTFVADDAAVHCATIAFNGAGTVGWIDGSEISWSAAWSDYGSTTGAKNVYIGQRYDGVSPMTGGVIRFRLDHAAATLADHQALCGTWTAPLVATHAAYADSTYTHAGGARCLQSGANRATCFPGGAAAYRWDGTDYRWQHEDSRTNRILYSSAPVCATGWTCGGGATIALAAAPDGSLTAGTFTLGGGTVDVAGTGYTAATTVYPRLWVKCAAGTLSIVHPGEAGNWDVDCTAIGGAWTEIYTGHAAVTENAAWASTAAGALTMQFSAVDASVWMPTATLVDGYSVIPTAAAAVATGDAAWSIANATGTYWKTGDTVTTDITLLGAAPCWVTGSPLYLTGAVGTECTGGVKSVEVVR